LGALLGQVGRGEETRRETFPQEPVNDQLGVLAVARPATALAARGGALKFAHPAHGAGERFKVGEVGGVHFAPFRALGDLTGADLVGAELLDRVPDGSTPNGKSGSDPCRSL
jgi:hypothetical protein